MVGIKTFHTGQEGLPFPIESKFLSALLSVQEVYPMVVFGSL